MEAAKARIAEILDKIKTEANPEVLNKYRSLIRKNSPLFMRSYIAAYLIMQEHEDNHRRSEGKTRNPSKRKNSLSGRSMEAKSKNEAPRNELSDEESTKLFISVGRNRRVFPREILGLILSESNLDKDDVGSIRILDNYSFVQIRKEKADDVIEVLNGKQFRGRTLTVNHARPRKEETDSEISQEHDRESY